MGLVPAYEGLWARQLMTMADNTMMVFIFGTGKRKCILSRVYEQKIKNLLFPAL